jgi:transposase InsO family protein
VKAPILAHPDFSQPFILDTDASNNGIGAVLSQLHDGQETVIAYASRTLTKAERNYCVTRKELLAVVHFVKYFRHYLYGKSFLVRTDHSSLRWLTNFKNPEGQLARWLEVLSSYDMTIAHRPGAQHCNADALSRLPCRQCGFTSDWEETQVKAVRIATADDWEETQVKTAYRAPASARATHVPGATSPIEEEQHKDEDISLVCDWLREDKRPDYKDIASAGIVLKSLWAQWDLLTLSDGILCRKQRTGRSRETRLQAVIPREGRRTVLEQYHDAKTAGHLGVRKTLSKVRQHYYWPGLKRDVRMYIAGCEHCAKRKKPTQKKRAPMQVVESGIPMERLATDILGELPETEDGNRYILVVGDYHTKWTEAFPMPNMEAATVAKIIVEQVVARLGVPVAIHSDQGRQFESRLFAEMCQLLHINKTRTAPYNPQSDGMIERFNKTLATMLSAFVSEHQRDWDTYLPYVMMAYRSVDHETTSCSPNLMMLGREVGTPLDLMYEMPSNIKRIPATQWAWELQDRMEVAHKFVRKHVQGEMRRQKKYHDKKLSWENFKPGDQVYVFFPQRKVGRSPKLTSFWRGPYTVKGRYSDVTCSVNCGPRGHDQVIHIYRMRMKQSQVLAGENEQAIRQEELETDEPVIIDEPDVDIVDTEVCAGRPVRTRHAPVRFGDYQL